MTTAFQADGFQADALAFQIDAAAPPYDAELQDGPWHPTDFRRGYTDLVLERQRRRDADETALLMRRK